MRIHAGILAVICTHAQPVLADLPIQMPSGQQAVLLDTLADEMSDSLRLRFVVPAIADATIPYARMIEEVFEDMEWLCETQTDRHFPNAQGEGWSSAVITMLSEPVEFGTRDAGVIQFFESFLLTDEGCRWDVYDD